jgi:hypothetical protein
MKRKLLLSALLLTVALAAWMYFAPRVRVDHAARNNDPAKMDLWNLPTMCKSMKRLPNGVEVGLIHLQDASEVRYWFVSGHVQPGAGLTRFDFPDGETAYLGGVFCCEVWIRESALKNKVSMLRFISEFDGASP